MEYCYDNKYKDRIPQETVSIIKNYFINQGFNCQELNFYKTEFNTWSGTIQLYLNNYLILTSHGKGISYDYCLASAYGELFERFNNKIFYMGHPFIEQDVAKASYLKNGFYLSSQEKILSFEEAIKPFEDTFSYLGTEDEIRSFFNTITDNRFIGLPFQSAIDDHTVYLDPRFLLRARGSTGMAAGNSFYEAFNQGFSEILEHCTQRLFYTTKYDSYHEIPLETIVNSKLIEIIHSIQATNNELHIFDCSYNTGYPVIMAVLINHSTNTISANIGAFPIFDIALERVLTEVHQGFFSFNNVKIYGQFPYYNEKYSSVQIRYLQNLSRHDTFPEEIILRRKYTIPNSQIFLQQEKISNIDIFNYYISLCKQYNIKIYTYNYSKIYDMSAIAIYSPDLIGLANETVCQHLQDKSNVYLFLLQCYDFIGDVRKNKVNFSSLLSLMEQYNKFNDLELYLCNKLLCADWFSVNTILQWNASIWQLINFCLSKEFDQEWASDIYSQCYNNNYMHIKKFILISRYKLLNLYSNVEIIKILEFLGIEISQEDLEKYNDSKQLLNSVIFYPLQEFYSSNFYAEYLTLLLDNYN